MAMGSLANVIMTLYTKLKFCQFGSTFSKYDVYGTHEFLKNLKSTLEIHFQVEKTYVYHKTQTKIGVEYGFTRKNLCIYHVLKLQCRFTWRAH